jgi:hypothetical protein
MTVKDKFKTLIITVIAFALTSCERQPPEIAAYHPTKYMIDGESSDWSSDKIFINEVGALSDSTSRVDLKQLYLDYDDSFLYLFIKCDPGLVTHFKKHPVSGILAYLYLDYDQDITTGADRIDHSGNEAILGTETRIWIPLGTAISLTSNETAFTVSFEVSQWNPHTGEFDSHFRADSKFSNCELVSYTDDGVEMAIPLESLNLSTGNSFDLICCEWANNTPEHTDRREVILK